jgi:hypothetical protein
MTSLTGFSFFSKVREKIVSRAKGFQCWGLGCGERSVPGLGYLSITNEFTTFVDLFVADHLTVTLGVGIPYEQHARVHRRGPAGRQFWSLPELHELLEESLRSSSHSQEKRNESGFPSGIQDLVEPQPQITVSISRRHGDLGIPLEDYADALLEFVVKFRTKVHIAFSTPDRCAELLQIAIELDCVGLAKFAVVMEPLRISNNSCLCPATVVAKVMKCASTLQVVTLLLAIRGYLQFKPNILTNTLAYREDITKSNSENQKLPGVWNLNAKVHGVLLPRLWAKTELNAQVLKLEVTLEPVVTGACSMAIGVRNVHVEIENASLHSSSSNVLGFFLSHITVSIRPEVEGQVLLMLLEKPSPNEPYDISATRTIALSASVTGSKNPGVAMSATESSSDTIKWTTTDWRYEQTRGDEFTGNFSWTLRRLAGVPFDYAQPKCTKVSTRMSILKRRPVTSMLELPFNRNGSVTFSEQCPETIQWTLAPELAGTDVSWYVSVTVDVTMLDRSTGTGKTLEFWYPHHFLHNMSTDVECTHS